MPLFTKFSDCLRLSLLGILIILIGMGCSSSEEEEEDDPNTRTYHGIVVNAITGDPVPGVEVRFYEYMGGTLSLDIVDTVSDENGMFTVKTAVNEDTLAQMLEEYMLTPDVVHQQIFVESKFYRKKQMEQNGEIFPQFRAKIIEEDLITVSVWETGVLKLTFEDTINPELYGNTSVRFRSKDPDIGFLYGIGNPNNQSPDWEIKIPSDMDIVTTWETYEGPTYDSTELVRTDSTEFRFEFMERQDFVIYH